MAHADKLDDWRSPRSNSRPGITLARRGQHVLTRREILRYVTAEGSTRAEQIQELLDLGEVEEIRKTLVKVEDDYTKAVPLAQSHLTKAQSAVNATIQEKTFSMETTLAFVNQCRLTLGGSPIPKSVQRHSNCPLTHQWSPLTIAESTGLCLLRTSRTFAERQARRS